MDGTVIVTLFSTREKFEELGKEAEVGVTELNERQKRAVEYVKRHGKITNKEYRQLNPNITDRTVLNDFNELIDKGIITAKGEKKYRHYTLR